MTGTFASRMAALVLTAMALPAVIHAQDATEEPQGAWRTRIGAGPQFVPRFPGSGDMVVRPFLDLSRARGDTPFEFEAADESAGLPLLRQQGFDFGPALTFEGSRRTRDVPGVPRVGFTVEAGGFLEYKFAKPLRARLEVRQGIGGHEGLVGMASVDYIARDQDEWLFAIGPRLSFSDGGYQRAYFGVPASATAASGLPAFRPDGGLHAVGGTVTFLKQLDRHWGISTYGKYDRLIQDAGRSPIVDRFDSQDQWSGGVMLTYTFGVAND